MFLFMSLYFTHLCLLLCNYPPPKNIYFCFFECAYIIYMDIYSMSINAHNFYLIYKCFNAKLNM